MRALACALLLVAGGCAGDDDGASCPRDPVGGAVRCLVPLDLSLPVATSCPGSYFDLTHDPPPCAPGLRCAYHADDAGVFHTACYCGDDGTWRCD